MIQRVWICFVRGQGSVCGLLQLGDCCTSVAVGEGSAMQSVALVRQGFRHALAGWLTCGTGVMRSLGRDRGFSVQS